MSVQPLSATPLVLGAAPGSAATATHAPTAASVVQRSPAPLRSPARPASPGPRTTTNRAAAPPARPVARPPAQRLDIGGIRQRPASSAPGQASAPAAPAPAAGSRGTPTVQRMELPQMLHDLGDRAMGAFHNATDDRFRSLTDRVSEMPLTFGSALTSFGLLHSHNDAISGELNRAKLDDELRPAVLGQSPLLADPIMWRDLMSVFEKYTDLTAKIHKRQTELAIAQSLVSTNEAVDASSKAIQAFKIATEETLQRINMSVDKAFKDLLHDLVSDESKLSRRIYQAIAKHVRVDDDLHSNVARRLRAEMRMDRERFGQLRDSMR
jgi:hypothetical protein